MSDIVNTPKAKKIEGALCYLAGVLFAIVYLSSEPYKSNGFLRFHSFQSIAFTLIWAALTILTDSVRFQLRWFNTLVSMLWLFFFVTWIVLIFQAYCGRQVKLPVIGNLAEHWAR